MKPQIITLNFTVHEFVNNKCGNYVKAKQLIVKRVRKTVEMRTIYNLLLS